MPDSMTEKKTFDVPVDLDRDTPSRVQHDLNSSPMLYAAGVGDWLSDNWYPDHTTGVRVTVIVEIDMEAAN